MLTLVIDTATTACSVALFRDLECTASSYEVIGRGHAEKLLPIIASLPNKGKADQIIVNAGPGSFTGIRVGVAAAKALALAWGIPCSGYSCMQLLAAMARHNGPVDVINSGGHGEYFFQSFDANIAASNELASITPTAVPVVSNAPYIVGDAATLAAELRGSGHAVTMLPDAGNWYLIAGMETLAASPIYGRAPDAKLPNNMVP